MRNATKKPLLVDYDEAAELLDVSRNTVRRLVSTGKIKPVKFGRHAVRLRLADVERIADGTVELA